MKLRHTWVGALALVSVTGSAIADELITGNPVAMGRGWAQVFVQLGEKGSIRTLGITLSETALDGLPQTGMEFPYELDLPIAAPPFDHVGINWVPHGHPPMNIYSVPHFDFHFYTITRADRNAMTCEGLSAPLCTQMPRPELIPAGHIAGDPVPHMGWHWVDPNSPEFHGQPFTKTFIYGFYAGQQAFFEPMITLDYLRSKPDSSTLIPLPAAFSQPGFYPSSYRVAFDTESRTYQIALEGLFQVSGN